MSEEFNLSDHQNTSMMPKLGSIIAIIFFLILISIVWWRSNNQNDVKKRLPQQVVEIKSKDESKLVSTDSSKVVGKNQIPDNLKIIEIKVGGLIETMQLNIPPKTAIMWKNSDDTKHQIQFVGENIKSSQLMKGDSFTRMFNEVGTFRFTTSANPEKIGVIEVK